MIKLKTSLFHHTFAKLQNITNIITLLITTNNINANVYIHIDQTLKIYITFYSHLQILRLLQK